MGFRGSGAGSEVLQVTTSQRIRFKDWGLRDMVQKAATRIVQPYRVHNCSDCKNTQENIQCTTLLKAKRGTAPRDFHTFGQLERPEN